MRFAGAGLVLTLVALIAVACAPVVWTASDRLIFQPEVYEDGSGEFAISLKVRNAGERVSPARPDANAVMELRDEHNILRARANVVHLIAIDPGDVLNPLVWRGRLDPGMYRLYWGAPGLGHTQVEFVLSQQDGRQRLEELRTMTYPDQDMPTLPTYGDAQPLVDLAIAQLAGQLGVESGLIRVERVEPVDFPDASLGAPQPLAPFLAGVGIMTVHTFFYLALVVLLGALFDVRPLILGVSLGMLLAGTLLSGFIKPLFYITPWILPKAASLAAASQPMPPDLLWPPLLASALWCLIFVLAALATFEKTEF